MVARRVGGAVGRGTLRDVSLVEAAVASVVAAIALGGLLFASAAAARFATHQVPAVRVACGELARQILRTAEDSWKYASAAEPAPQPSGTWTTSVPFAVPGASATSEPVTVDLTTTVETTPAPNDPTRESAIVIVTLNCAGGTVTAQSTLHVKAPVPGTVLDSGITVTPPPGAP